MRDDRYVAAPDGHAPVAPVSGIAAHRPEPDAATALSNLPATRPTGGPLARTVQRVLVQAGHLVGTVAGDDVLGRKLRVRSLALLGARIGKGTSIHGGGYVSRPANLTIGSDVFINRNCYFDLEGPIEIGDRATIGHGTALVTSQHQLGGAWQRCGPTTGESIRIESGAWLGANVIVLPGVTIGRGAVVAAGSVVTRSVDANALVAGVPARHQRYLDERPDGN